MNTKKWEPLYKGNIPAAERGRQLLRYACMWITASERQLAGTWKTSSHGPGNGMNMVDALLFPQSR
jgi:hypothetical protein